MNLRMSFLPEFAFYRLFFDGPHAGTASVSAISQALLAMIVGQGLKTRKSAA
jgi:hypothetical protein